MTATIRTFRAADAREALAAIKAALGPEAVILGTREVKGGFFSKTEVEVTAALPHAPMPLAAVAAKYAGQNAVAKTNVIQSQGEAGVEESASPSPAPTNAVTPPPLPRKSTRGFETRGDDEARMFPPGLSPAQSLKDELATLRSQMHAMQTAMHAPTALPTAALRLKEHLLARGMEPSLTDDVIRLSLERCDQPNGAVLMTALRDVLGERIVAGRAPWLADRRRIIGLVGPTGVGKTTTLAKIAAHALKQNQTVALITLDTFRIGAAEQLGHYGAIMKVPSFVARNLKELELCVQQSARADLVLIDTAGCSKKDQLTHQTRMVRGITGSQVYLVASAASGAIDLSAIVERYRPFAPERLILTKLDEAAAPAAFLSASFRLNRPIVAITDGQRVPEDIHAPSAPELIEQLIGPFTC